MYPDAAVAAPVWGTIAFLLGVWMFSLYQALLTIVQFFKDLPAIELDLKTVEHTIEQSRVRFEHYFGVGKPLTTDLKRALIKYYEAVINFVIDMHREFLGGRASTYPFSSGGPS